MFSQPVLVALDTGRGVVYAPASGWDKVCLLWTFRNFRSLPQNVLSPRQQHLIAALHRAASDYPANERHHAAIVGTVEGFKPSSLPSLAASAQSRKPATVPGRKPSHARFAFSGMTLKIATALLVIAIAVLAWHQLGAQPVAVSTPVQTVAAVHPDDVQIPISNSLATGTVETTTNRVGTSAPAVQRGAAPPAAATTPSTTAPPNPEANGGRASSPASTHPAGTHPAAKDGREHRFSNPTPAPTFEAAADQPRMQISGRPRKLVYPVCPETRARGKVSLQAVVGYDGAVNRVRVLTGDRTLAAAAIEAVRQWRYEPFSGAVPPLERETNITISFISNEVVAVSFPASAPLSR